LKKGIVGLLYIDCFFLTGFNYFDSRPRHNKGYTFPSRFHVPSRVYSDVLDLIKLFTLFSCVTISESKDIRIIEENIDFDYKMKLSNKQHARDQCLQTSSREAFHEHAFVPLLSSKAS